MEVVGLLFKIVQLLPFVSSVGGDGSCWSGPMTPELCCDTQLGPQGRAECWDGQYTFERCCQGGSGSVASSDIVSSLKVEPASMPHLTLLAGGRMPISGMGLCCRASAQGAAVRQGVLDYLLMGGRHLDDAMGYGNHREVGEAIREAMTKGVPRNEIFLTTKIAPADNGFESAKSWIDLVLQQLGLDYIDLVLLHRPRMENKNIACLEPKACRQETWLALQTARRQGKIKNLGVSNFGPRQMGEILALGGAPITANQLEFHPWVPRKHRETVAWCHQRRIAVTAFGSMGSAQYSQQMMLQGALQQIGAAHGKAVSQILLRWAVQQNVSVIPGTSNPKHMAENLRIFDFELSSNEMAALDRVPESDHMVLFGMTPDEDA